MNHPALRLVPLLVLPVAILGCLWSDTSHHAAQPAAVVTCRTIRPEIVAPGRLARLDRHDGDPRGTAVVTITQRVGGSAACWYVTTR